MRGVCWNKWKTPTGFTLAEVLIALALLGIVAAFSIPKILQSNQTAERKAVFNEVFASLQTIAMQGVADGTLTDTNFGTYFLDRLNSTQTCRTNSDSEGCWDEDVQGSIPLWASQLTMPGVIMPNEATIIGFDDCCGPGVSGRLPGEYSNGMVIDWNGKKPPNTYGDDQLTVYVCFGTVNCVMGTTRPLRPGMLFTTTATDTTAYQALYQ